MKKPRRFLLWLVMPMLLVACGGSPRNDPYPAAEQNGNILYSAFSERPKHLDPARSYSANEAVFTGQIYEPPLQYHYLKRPYTLIPLTAAALPSPQYFGKDGQRLSDSAPVAAIAYSVYEIRIRPGIYYQPHPALARGKDGALLYHALLARELERIDTLADFRESGTRELVTRGTYTLDSGTPGVPIGETDVVIPTSATS